MEANRAILGVENNVNSEVKWSVCRMNYWQSPLIATTAPLSLPHLQARMGEAREFLLKSFLGLKLWLIVN